MSELIRHRYSKYLQGLEAAALESSLPYIKGTWFYVDPDNGSNSRDGLTKTEAVADILTAYNRCTDGSGDGIVLLSGGTGTSSDTTSYLKQSLAWSKCGITVVGIAAPVSMFGRARIANVEVTTPANTTIAHTANSITRETGSFLLDGWVAGMKGKTVDSGSNNGSTFTVVTAAALTLTISETFNVQAKASVGSCVMTSYVPELIHVSGSNNAFLNVEVFNASSHALSLGCLKISGARNFFGNCHFVGAGHATPAAVATACDLALETNSAECTFVACTFGTDTIAREATNANVRFNGDANGVGPKRMEFHGCKFISMSATTTKGMLLSVGQYGCQGVQLFRDCSFWNWTVNGITNLASAFIGTRPASGYFFMDGCSCMGIAAWDSVGGNDRVYVANSDATAAGAGGIATTI